MSEAAYIKQLQDRIASYSDMKAYEALYKLLLHPLYRFAYSFTRMEETAEEIVSDTFVKLWERREKLGDIGNLKAYLFKTTKHLCINHLTRSHELPVVAIENLSFDDLIEWKDPEEILLSEEAIERIHGAIRMLPTQCRIIFQLVKIEGLSYQEAAEVLDISVSTVRNQMTIGLRKIMEALPVLDMAVSHARK